VNRHQLCKVLRAAAMETGLTDLVVVGSQAVLGTHEDWLLPTEATRSNEADVAVDIATAQASEGTDETALADQIDGAIGEGSHFHQTFGYYGQGVETATATLTTGWRERLVPLVCHDRDGETVNAVGWCLEIQDLWLSKAAAGRPKDLEYCLALARDGLVDLDEIHRRANELREPERTRAAAMLTTAARELRGSGWDGDLDELRGSQSE